jgi:hypothetical protein
VSEFFHAVIWLDHHEAKTFHFSADDVDRVLVRASDPDHPVVRVNDGGDGGRLPDGDDYFRRIAESVADAGAVLITGPASPKSELLTYITQNDSELLRRISGDQTVEHLTDVALLALARAYFKSDERMHPQR